MLSVDAIFDHDWYKMADDNFITVHVNWGEEKNSCAVTSVLQ